MSLGVKEISSASGVSGHTVRYYVRRGLLTPPQNAHNGYHEFTAADAHALSFIRRAQALGFTLAEIATILEMSRRRRSPCPMVRDIISHRIDEVGARLRGMRQLHQRMELALAQWRRMSDGVPNGHDICRLIESIALDADARESGGRAIWRARETPSGGECARSIARPQPRKA